MISQGDYGPIQAVSKCIEQLMINMYQDFLQLNEDKTETIVFPKTND